MPRPCGRGGVIPSRGCRSVWLRSPEERGREEGEGGGEVGRAGPGLGLVGHVSKELDFCPSSREKALRVMESDRICVFKRSLCLEGTRDQVD